MIDIFSFKFLFDVIYVIPDMEKICFYKNVGSNLDSLSQSVYDNFGGFRLEAVVQRCSVKRCS